MIFQSQKKKYDKLMPHLVGEKVIDFLLPPVCPMTGEIVDKIGMIAPDLWGQLEFIHNPFCRQCGLPFAYDIEDALCVHCLDHPPSYRSGRSALRYNDASRDMIIRFKHGDQLHAVKTFTPWMFSAGRDLLLKADIITPVPLHPLRLIKRRYNQADVLARGLTPLVPDAHYIPCLLYTSPSPRD